MRISLCFFVKKKQELQLQTFPNISRCHFVVIFLKVLDPLDPYSTPPVGSSDGSVSSRKSCKSLPRLLKKTWVYQVQPRDLNKCLDFLYINGLNYGNNLPLRIMGSQNWWFGDPRPLLYTSKPFYSRFQ